MNGRQRSRLKLDYGKGFVGFLDELIDLFPKNGHWRTIRQLRGKGINPVYDLILALDVLEAEGVISVDQSTTLITRYRLGGGGGRDYQPTKEQYQVFQPFNKSRKYADGTYRV